LQRFLPALARINPGFDPGWINNSWLYRTSYAQPVPFLTFTQYSFHPDPHPGLYFASMSQVYPWIVDELRRGDWTQGGQIDAGLSGSYKSRK